MRTRSVTPEAFHVLGIGTEVGGQALEATDDAEPLGDLAGVGSHGPGVEVLLQRLSDDIGGADASLPGRVLETSFEAFADPDVDPFCYAFLRYATNV